MKAKDIDGTEIELTWHKDGYWVDSYGTRWTNSFIDPGYCGLEGYVETGEWDPFWKPVCKPHDEAFNNHNAGSDNRSGIEVTSEFVGGVAKVMALGGYALALGVPYIVLGGLGGLLRWSLKDKRK